MMIFFNRFISGLSLLLFLSCQVSGQDTFPKTLYVEGKRPGFFKDGTYFIYIEFNGPDDVYGYKGCYPFSGKYFGDCWGFKMNRSGNKYISDRVPETQYDTVRTERIYLENISGTWYATYKDKKQVISPLPNNYNNKLRNFIYACAVFEFKNFGNRGKPKAVWGVDPSTYREDPVFNLSFYEFSELIDKMGLEELGKFVHTNYPNY